MTYEELITNYLIVTENSLYRYTQICYKLLL